MQLCSVVSVTASARKNKNVMESVYSSQHIDDFDDIKACKHNIPLADPVQGPQIAVVSRS